MNSRQGKVCLVHSAVSPWTGNPSWQGTILAMRTAPADKGSRSSSHSNHIVWLGWIGGFWVTQCSSLQVLLFSFLQVFGSFPPFSNHFVNS